MQVLIGEMVDLLALEVVEHKKETLSLKNTNNVMFVDATASVAQLVEQHIRNVQVVGSIPTAGSFQSIRTS
jgi:hypothetical protein